MFLRGESACSKRIKASSVAAQIFLIAMMTFIFIGFTNIFYVLTVHNELTRFAKAAALYSLSLSRDFELAQDESKNVLLNETKAKQLLNQYISSYGSKVCDGSQCTITGTKSYVYATKAGTGANGNPICASPITLSLPREANPPETLPGDYIWKPCEPAVAVEVSAEVYVPVLWEPLTIRVLGKAYAHTLTDTPTENFLPWE